MNGHKHRELMSEGQTLDGRYLIIKKIGQGGMGTVYLARDINLNRNVAIKTILKETDRSDEILERTKHEGRMLSKLSHSSLVTIFEMNMESPEPYIVLDYIEGSNLRTLIDSGRLLSNEEGMKLLKEQASALRYVHEKGLIHRDIKPENIIITPEGNSVLMDFGLASDKNMTNLTREGTFLGTLQYSAPEVLYCGQAKPSSDIYQLGLVVHEALTAQSYLGNFSSILELTTLITSGEWDGQTVSPHISTELGEAITACCRFDEKDRIPNGEKLVSFIKQSPSQRKKRRQLKSRSPSNQSDSGRLANSKKITVDSRRKCASSEKETSRVKGISKASAASKTTNGLKALLSIAIIILSALTYMSLTAKSSNLDEGELITRAYLVDFNIIEIRYNNELNREIEFKLSESTTPPGKDEDIFLEKGIIDFSKPISSSGRTNTIQVKLHSPAYKNIVLTLKTKKQKILKLEADTLFQKKFKLINKLNQNNLIPLCRKFDIFRSIGNTYSEKNWQALLDSEGLNKGVLDEYERIIPLFLSSIDYRNNLYSEASELLTPFRVLSAFLSEQKVHKVFGLTSKKMGFEFSRKGVPEEDPSWIVMCNKNFRIGQTGAGSRYPILIYNFESPIVKKKILDKASATGSIMTLALVNDHNIDKNDLMGSFNSTLRTGQTFLATRKWPPVMARLSISFYSYGASPYFTVNINGNKAIKVFATWPYRKGMGMGVIASMPIPVSWLNKENNYLTIVPQRITGDDCFDMIQMTLDRAKLKVKFD